MGVTQQLEDTGYPTSIQMQTFVADDYLLGLSIKLRRIGMDRGMMDYLLKGEAAFVDFYLSNSLTLRGDTARPCCFYILAIILRHQKRPEVRSVPYAR